MFENILFATTGSPTCDAAANVAFDMAGKYNARLKVLHVFGFPSRGYSPYVVDVRTGDKEEEAGSEYHDWVVEELKNTYAKYLDKGLDLSIEARVGVPYTEVLRTARKENVDLIVMGAHSREEDVGAMRYRGVVGSTMQKVAKRARCPVLIVARPCLTCFWYFSNIVFATDFSRAADSAFLFAKKMAEAIGCKLHIFHAVDLSGMHIGKEDHQQIIERRVTDAKALMQSRYVEMLGDFDNYGIEVWEGIPHVEILKYAREKNGDLLIMAHHAREAGIEEADLGSTVEQVVLRSQCPVASVNHPDFVSGND